jgi:hypothetical protein
MNSYLHYNESREKKQVLSCAVFAKTGTKQRKRKGARVIFGEKREQLKEKM